MTSPVAYQVVQRSGGVGDIAVSGVTTETCKVEARWNGGSWATISASVNGSWSGTIEDVPEGQGTVEVRFTATGTGEVQTTTITPVGIGDVFIIGGQSNANGRSTYRYDYTGLPFAGRFGNNNQWGQLAEPFDDPAGQIDIVSKDNLEAGADNSIWGLVAAQLTAELGVPVAFVPSALGATKAVDWQAGADHLDRTTLYGSLNYRKSVTGAKGVIFILGETDAAQSTVKATFKGQISDLIDDLFADTGIKPMFCRVLNGSFNEAPMNEAITELWGENANTVAGADFSSIVADDGSHWQTQAKTEQAAALMADAILAGYYS